MNLTYHNNTAKLKTITEPFNSLLFSPFELLDNYHRLVSASHHLYNVWTNLLVSCPRAFKTWHQDKLHHHNVFFLMFFIYFSCIYANANCSVSSPVYAVRIPSFWAPHPTSPFEPSACGTRSTSQELSSNCNVAILRCHGLHICHCLHLFRCCIRNCQVWCRYLCYGCSPTWFDCQE